MHRRDNDCAHTEDDRIVPSQAPQVERLDALAPSLPYLTQSYLGRLLVPPATFAPTAKQKIRLA